MMGWQGDDDLVTRTIANRHGGRLPRPEGTRADKGATMDDRDIARQTAETRAARQATRLRGVTAREAEPTARVFVADLRRQLAEIEALRAAVARLEGEAEQADELLAEYAARTALADELVRLLQRIAILEDGTEAEQWQAIPLHGRVAELCGEYETTYLGGPEARDGQ